VIDESGEQFLLMRPGKVLVFTNDRTLGVRHLGYVDIQWRSAVNQIHGGWFQNLPSFGSIILDLPFFELLEYVVTDLICITC